MKIQRREIKMNLKSNKAITLVALIIIIIILLILAGVTLSMVLGDNGLINKAQSSGNKYQESGNNEQNILQNIEEYAKFKWKPTGSEVDLPDGWNPDNVTAIIDDKKNIIPVPKNFYYVGGNLDNGVIISDEPADAYDGVTDKTTWEYTTSLVGNQFVWMPCTEEEYHKTSWGSRYVYGSYDTSGPTDEEKAKVLKYGGFYVARYEAGLADTIKQYTASGATNNPGYNVEGIPKSQANQIPWNYINYSNSKKSAENMYAASNSVESTLITGTQWDVMVNKFIGITNENGLTITLADITDSRKWGNFKTNTIPYTGRLARVTSGSRDWVMYAFGQLKTGNTTSYSDSSDNFDLITTGSSKITEAYHTYDVAGNMQERTEEIGSNSSSHVLRGVSYTLSRCATSMYAL